MIYLGADHAGFELKEAIKKYLKELGYQYRDFGNTKLEPNDDYPDFALAVARAVKAASDSLGILCCGSGAGMCVAANKVKGIQAAVAWNKSTARQAREHGHINILCLGGRILNKKEAKEIVKVWLETKPSSEKRHLRRINKLKKIEARQ